MNEILLYKRSLHFGSENRHIRSGQLFHKKQNSTPRRETTRARKQQVSPRKSVQQYIQVKYDARVLYTSLRCNSDTFPLPYPSSPSKVPRAADAVIAICFRRLFSQKFRIPVQCRHLFAPDNSPCLHVKRQGTRYVYAIRRRQFH